MREKWTDERLDDGFERVRSEISVLRSEIGGLRMEVRDEIGGLRGEVGELRMQFVALQRTLLQVGGGLIAAMLGIVLTQL